MVKEKKERTQYNWKFKENEAKEFYMWFDKQENIANSLRSILYHVIELYGTENILDPSIQKQLVKNTLILESLKDKNVLSINPDLIFANSLQVDNEKKSAAASNSNIDENHDKNSTAKTAKINDSANLEKELILTKSKIDFGNVDTDLF